MVSRSDCPTWCTEHVVGPGAGQHRAVRGDVRLTLSESSELWEATYAVRRRAGRTAAEMAELAANMSAAGDLLRHERGRRHVFRGNSVNDPAASALAWV